MGVCCLLRIHGQHFKEREIGLVEGPGQTKHPLGPWASNKGFGITTKSHFGCFSLCVLRVVLGAALSDQGFGEKPKVGCRSSVAPEQ